MLSPAVAVTLTVPETVALAAGAVRLTVGAVGSYVTVKVALPGFCAASFAVIVMTFAPASSGMPAAVQLVVPVAGPFPPRSFAHVTWLTPTLSLATPPTVSGVVFVADVAPAVGLVIATVGGVVSGGGVPPTSVVIAAWFSTSHPLNFTNV